MLIASLASVSDLSVRVFEVVYLQHLSSSKTLADHIVVVVFVETGAVSGNKRS